MRHALAISGSSAGGLDLRRGRGSYRAVEIDGGSGAKNALKEEGRHTIRADGPGSAPKRGGSRLLLDAYGDSLKNVALMLWKSGYGMHQRKV